MPTFLTFDSANAVQAIMPFKRPAPVKVPAKKLAVVPVIAKPVKPARFSAAQLASSYIREDDGWLMVEMSPGCFVGQKPKAKSAANDNAPATAVAA